MQKTLCAALCWLLAAAPSLEAAQSAKGSPAPAQAQPLRVGSPAIPAFLLYPVSPAATSGLPATLGLAALPGPAAPMVEDAAAPGPALLAPFSFPQEPSSEAFVQASQSAVRVPAPGESLTDVYVMGSELFDRAAAGLPSELAAPFDSGEPAARAPLRLLRLDAGQLEGVVQGLSRSHVILYRDLPSQMLLADAAPAPKRTAWSRVWETAGLLIVTGAFFGADWASKAYALTQRSLADTVVYHELSERRSWVLPFALALGAGLIATRFWLVKATGAGKKGPDLRQRYPVIRRAVTALDVGLSMVVGGFLGNGLDIHLRGRVLDFIPIGGATANVADALLVFGGALTLGASMFLELARKADKAGRPMDFPFWTLSLPAVMGLAMLQAMPDLLQTGPWIWFLLAAMAAWVTSLVLQPLTAAFNKTFRR